MQRCILSLFGDTGHVAVQATSTGSDAIVSSAGGTSTQWKKLFVAYILGVGAY